MPRHTHMYVMSSCSIFADTGPAGIPGEEISERCCNAADGAHAPPSQPACQDNRTGSVHCKIVRPSSTHANPYGLT
jgi:hypothetical protein